MIGNIRVMGDGTVGLWVWGEYHCVSVGDLEAAANQCDRDLAAVYGKILTQVRAQIAQQAVRAAAACPGHQAVRSRDLSFQGSVNPWDPRQAAASCKHESVSRSEPYCFNCCVATEPHTDCDPRAHGNVVFTETCRCGAFRYSACNQNFEENSVWFRP